MGKYQSGQMGQTVNLLAYAFGGSNPSLPTENQIVIERSCLIFCLYIPWRLSSIQALGSYREPKTKVHEHYPYISDNIHLKSTTTSTKVNQNVNRKLN